MSKRILSLVLALVMVLGTFSFTFATPSDVAGTEYEEAVDRLILLGVLTGYPDGSFKPENQITRAEFTAVAVRLKGLESAAQAAKGLPTGFSDVPASHWASGYVGTAAKAGIVNGIGNGKFAPQAPVKYEEAVTMLVRALGYEVAAQSRGGYPFGYLIVASEIGLLDAVKGTQGAPATRGMVAQMADNALEIPMMIQVGYGTETKWVKSGTEGTDEKFLLDEMGFDTLEGRVVKVNTKKNEIVLEVEENDKIVNKTLDVAEGFDFYEVEGLTIKAWLDDSEVIVYTLKDEAKFDAVEVDDDELKLVIEDESYEVAKDAYLELNGKKVKQDEFNADYAKVVVDDGEIVWAEGYELDGFIVVKEVEDEVAYSYDDYDELNLEDYLIVKDGKTISADELEEQDILFYNNEEEFAVVYNNSIQGEIERVYDDNIEFRLDGKTYKVAEEALFLDEEVIGELDVDVLEAMMDEESTVEVFLNYAEEVVLVVGERGEKATNSFYGLVTFANVYEGRKGWTLGLDVLNKDGEELSYDIVGEKIESSDEYKFFDGELVVRITTGEAIEVKVDTEYIEPEVAEVTIDEDGDITGLEVLKAVSVTIDDDDNAIDLTKTYFKGYKLEDSTIIFYGEDHEEVVELGKVEDFTKVTAGKVFVNDKDRIVVIVADETDGEDEKVADLVTKVRKLSSDDDKFKVEFTLANGDIYVTKDKVSVTDYNKYKEYVNKKVVELVLDKQTGNVKEVNDDLRTVEEIEVTERNTGKKTINNKYELVSGAKLYDITGSKVKEIRLSDIAKGDEITVYYDNDTTTRFVKFVIRTKVAEGSSEPEEPQYDATLAYDFKLTTDGAIDGKLVHVNIEGEVKSYTLVSDTLILDKNDDLITAPVTIEKGAKIKITLVEGTKNVSILKFVDYSKATE